MKIISVSKMIELEKQANSRGLGYDQMMMKAGSALADVVQRRYGSISKKHVLGLIGSGNNGGDTMIALSKLIENGWTATAYLVKKREKSDVLVAKLIDMKCDVVKAEDDPSSITLRKIIPSCDVILDGILGTGIKLPLRKEIGEVLQVFSEFDELPKIVAVDCPSGVNSSSGEADSRTLFAQMTVCMAAVKEGLLKFPAFKFVGEIVCVDIGLPEDLLGLSDLRSTVVDQEMVSKKLPLRPMDGHKGTFGTCMIVGGSINYCGAVILSARSAYKVGAGLVRAAIPGAIYDTIAGQIPECTWVVLPHSAGIIDSSASATLLENLERVDVLLIGPGMGQEKETFGFLKGFLQFKKIGSGKPSLGFSQQTKKEKSKQQYKQPTLVFDADALRLLPRIDNWYRLLEKTAVLTPHPGEMAVLTRLTIDEIQNNREKIAREYAQKWGHVVVLKGAVTVVASPSGDSFSIPIATPALATAGTGDVLAGMITGLLCQRLSAVDAAVVGTWLHATAGKFAEAQFGQNISITAGDVINQIPNVLK